MTLNLNPIRIQLPSISMELNTKEAQTTPFDSLQSALFYFETLYFGLHEFI